jgi:hypothetical protein
MSDQPSWNANQLTAPLHLLVNKKLTLPPGPVESAPLDGGQWWISFTKERKGWVMSYGWSSEVARARDLVIEWTVDSEEDLKGLGPILEVDAVGTALADFGNRSVKYPPEGWDIDRHLAAKSQIQLTVECPSLSSSWANLTCPRSLPSFSVSSIPVAPLQAAYLS